MAHNSTLWNLPPVVREFERYNRKSLLMSIDYVRVNRIDRDDGDRFQPKIVIFRDDRDGIENEIDSSDSDDGDESESDSESESESQSESDDGYGIEDKIDVYGTVVASSDDCEHDIIYHRPSSNPDSKGLGEYLSLPDPPQDILACQNIITVNLWAILWKDGKKITREIARGYVGWNAATRLATGTDTHLESPVFGRHGSVSVGFSVVSKGLSATVKIQMMNESPAQIYGTIKAHRLFKRSSPMAMLMLFHKSAKEWIQVNPKHSIPLTRSFFPVAAPVPTSTRSYLTIKVDLWNHDEGNLMSPDYQIAKGSVKFTPKFGEQMKTITTKNYGQVQVHITFQ